MKILYIGAGVIGSITAAKLSNAGQEITVLARGKRLEQIRRNGIIIQNGITGETESCRVNTISRLGAEDYYDLAVVPVRADHLPEILPVLASNKRIPDILIMANNPKGYGEIIRALGEKRFLLGFPGMGGGIVEDVVKYQLAKAVVQPTTFGEIDGRRTKRLVKIAAVFKKAGFPVAIERNMEAWQITHVCWISPFSAAIYMAGGSAYKLAGRTDILKLMIRAIRESYRALKKTGIPVTPSKLKVFDWMPMPLLVKIFQKQCDSKEMEFLATMHCNNAPVEMRQLADDLLALVEKASVKMDALKKITSYIPSA